MGNSRTADCLYGTVPLDLVTDERITKSAIRVYVALSSFQGGNANCWPTREAICERSGLSKSVVSKALTELENTHWIERQIRKSEAKPSIYRVLRSSDTIYLNDEKLDHSQHGADKEPSPGSVDYPSPGTQDYPSPGTQDISYKQQYKLTTKKANGSKEPSRMKDGGAQLYQDQLLEHTPIQAWGNIPKERKCLNTLSKKTSDLSLVTGLPFSQLAGMVVTTYREMKRVNRSDYWRSAPITPSGIIARWDAIVENLRQSYAAEVGYDAELGF